MLISIIGTRASGKSAVEQYLVSTHRFQRVKINNERDAYPSREPKRITADLTLSSLHHPEDAHTNLEGEVPLNRELSNHDLYFQAPSDLLDYVTRNWREPFVTCDLSTSQLIEPFIKRPFFLLVSVDAPLLTRYTRLLSNVAPNLSLQSFVEEHDSSLYGSEHARYGSYSEAGESRYGSLRDLFRFANVHILNTFDTIAELHIYLNEVNLPDADRLRPRWDTYFMTLASLASQRSNCMKRRVGAILVRDKRIVSTGYNGTPRNVRNCNEGGCRRCNRGGPSGEALDECLCLHAEENALLEAGRERVGEHAVLYCNTCPCLGCAIKIVQTGVKEVVYNLSYKVDDRTAALFKEAGVTLRQHSPP